MSTFARYITAAASATFFFTVVQFEALTGLSSAWERPENRKLIEARLTLNHTSYGAFNKTARDNNVGLMNDNYSSRPATTRIPDLI